MRDVEDRQSETAANPLSAAYEQRTKELYDARGALAEAVSTLTAELERVLDENRGLSEHVTALRAEIEKLEHGLAAANRRTDVVLNMKVVRWTAWPRGVVYRLRTRWK